MASTPYYFGSFNLNDGVNYFLLSKDSPSMVNIQETLFKIGRLEGMKKTGQVVNERTITVQVRILGTSRIDLENKIDALKQALVLQQQQLKLHANDGRYYTADCIAATIPLGPGNVVTTVASLKFLCPLPYALAASASTFDTGIVTLTLVSGSLWQWLAPFTVTGGGNIYSRPTIRLYARNAQAWTQVQIQQSTDAEYFFVTSNLPAVSGDYIDIVCDPYAINGAKVFKNGNSMTLCQVSGVFPILEATATTWNIQVTAANPPVANPSSAPGLTTATTGGVIPAGTYTVGYTWVGSGSGETQVSPTAQITTTGSTSTITVTVPATPTGAAGWNLYISAAGQTTPLYKQNSSTLTGTSFTQTAAISTSGANPPASNMANVPQAEAVFTWTPRWES